jgi:hypothetical protein
MIITILDGAGEQVYRGDHADLRAAVVHCAASRISLAGADLRATVLDDADLTGLWAPNCDLRGASCQRVRMTGPRVAELSASLLQDCDFAGAVMPYVNLACTKITRFHRVQLGDQSRIRGCNWSACPDVIVLPVRDDNAGKVIALRNGIGWKVHSGDRGGCKPEAEAKQLLTMLPDRTARERYVAAFAYLESAEGLASKAAIDALMAASLPASGGRAR